MEEKLYREAYEEITWFLHSSPRVKSIAIDRYVDLHKLYQGKTWETHLYATHDHLVSTSHKDCPINTRKQLNMLSSFTGLVTSPMT